jgi:hypothetical protein
LFIFLVSSADKIIVIEAQVALVFSLISVLVFSLKKELQQKAEQELLREQPNKGKIFRNSVITRLIGMATCKRCGKGGLFHRVNDRGLCVNCTRIEALEAESQKIQEEIDRFKFLRIENETAYNETKLKREILYNEIADKAKKYALDQIASQINDKNIELQSIINSIEENKRQLDDLIAEQNKSHKGIESNANII